MMVNLLFTIGIIYVFFWNFVSVLTWAFFRKTDKNIRWIPIIIGFATIPPFLFGFFAHD